jgi:hypothetical protein
MITRGHITFLTAVAAAIIIIVAPHLPQLPHPHAMECYNDSDANSKYCKALAVAVVILRRIVETIDQNHDILIVVGTLIIAWFTFTLWESTHRLWLASQDQGRDTKAALLVGVFALLDGKYASEHDAKIARKLAHVLCGGDLW